MDNVTMSEQADLFELVQHTLDTLSGDGLGVSIAPLDFPPGLPRIGIGSPEAIRARLINFITACQPAPDATLRFTVTGCWRGRRVTVIRLTLTTAATYRKGYFDPSSSRSLHLPVNVESEEPSAWTLGHRRFLDPQRRVLVVDDDAVSRRLISGLLLTLGCETTLAENGATAIAMTHDFDVIFMDCDMPEMSGYQTTAGIRRHQTVYTPIVAVTATVPDGWTARTKCLQSGMDDYLPKPVGVADIRGALQWWAPLGDC